MSFHKDNKTTNDEAENESVPSYIKTPREKILERTAPNFRHANRLMWVGTLSVSVIMIGLWVFSFMTQVSFFKWTSSSEATLLQNTREQWNSLMNTEKPRATTNTFKADVMKALETVVSSSLATASTTKNMASSTITAPTTSSTSSATTSTAKSTNLKTFGSLHRSR